MIFFSTQSYWIVLFANLTFPFVSSYEESNVRSNIQRSAQCPQGSTTRIVIVRFNALCYCAGTLLNNFWVLTAAHCLRAVDVPQTQILVRIELTRPLTYDVLGIYIHPKFDGKYNDIALMRLYEPVLVNVVGCVKLPQSNVNHCSVAIVSGWGNNVSDSNKCLYSLNCVLLSVIDCAASGVVDKEYSRGLICGLVRDGKNVCGPGNVGGPLTCNDVQIGIAIPLVDRCNSTNLPSFFTKVSAYLDFIQETISAKYIKSGTNVAYQTVYVTYLHLVLALILLYYI